MQQVQVSSFGISIHGRDDLTARVRDLRPATREALAQAIARQAHDSDASAIAEYFWLQAEDLEALVATFAARDAEFKDQPVHAPAGTQAAALQAIGFDPVALGGKVVDGEVFKPDANPDDRGRCANCGRPGVWISGAGRFLCFEHQDDY